MAKVIYTDEFVPSDYVIRIKRWNDIDRHIVYRLDNNKEYPVKILVTMDGALGCVEDDKAKQKIQYEMMMAALPDVMMSARLSGRKKNKVFVSSVPIPSIKKSGFAWVDPAKEKGGE